MTVPMDPLPGDCIGRWEVTETLRRRGGMTTVRVRPRTSKGGLAVLVLHAHSSATAAQAEVAALSPLLDLEVEGFDTILDLGLHGLVSWWVRPPLRGQPLDQAVLPLTDSATRCATLRRWGARAAQVLARLHARGIWHGALGVEAVRVDQAGGVTLAGIRELPAGSRPGTSGAGAPEQLAGGPPSAAADVYSLGAALHLALSDSPSGHDTVTTPWGGGAKEPAPSPCLVRPDADLDLCTILEETLDLAPAERPAADHLARRLAAPPRPGAAGPRCPVTLGRGEVLEGLIETLQGTGPSLSLVRGPAGSGRHQVVDAALRQVLRDGVQLLRVRARPDRPGAAIAELLAQALSLGPEQATLGDDGPVLWTLWPELEGGGAAAPGEVEATALIAAACRVFARAAGRAGLVLCVDRLEQADPLTLRALARIARLGGPRVHAVGIVDDRSPPSHLRRWLRRIEDRELGVSLRLPDLDAEVAGSVARKVQPLADGPVPAEAGSPQRAVEQGHAAYFSARGEPWHPPPESLLPLALQEAPVRRAVIAALGVDPDKALEAGWLRSTRAGLELCPRYLAWAAARLPRLSVAHDALADAIAAGDARPEARRWEALHRLLGSTPSRARRPLAEAALCALETERPSLARGWLLTIDRLRRPPRPDDADLPAARALRARLRAELALRNGRSLPRPELLAQYQRRAQSDEDNARVRILEGWQRRRLSDPSRARTTWRSVAVDPGVPPGARAEAARLWTEASLEVGLMEDAAAAVAVARAAAQLTDDPDASRHAALAELEHRGALGDARHIADQSDSALAATTDRPLSGARVLLLRARASRELDEPSAAQDEVVRALALLHTTPGGQTERLGLRVLQAHLALDRGAPERARQLLRQTHPTLGQLTGFSRGRLIARWWAAALRLASWCGEHQTAEGLLAHGPHASTPAEQSLVLAARLAHARVDTSRRRRGETLGTLVSVPAPTAAAAEAHAHAAMACLIEGPLRSYHHHAAEARRLAERAGARELILHARLLQTVDTKIRPRWAYLASRARSAARLELRVDACALAAVLAQRTGDAGGAAQALLQLQAELDRSRRDGLRPWAAALEEWLATEETTQVG